MWLRMEMWWSLSLMRRWFLSRPPKFLFGFRFSRERTHVVKGKSSALAR